MSRELVYDFRAQGAEETAARVRQLNEEFKRGGIGLEEYGRKKRELRSDTRNYADTFRMEQQLWLAAHPNAQKLTQSMAMVGSVMQTGLAVQNAWNLAQLVSQGQTAAVTQAQAQLTQAQREYNIAVQQFGEDSIEAADARERLKTAETNLADAQKASQAQMVSMGITMVESGVLITSSIVQVLPNIARLGVTGAIAGAAHAAGMAIASGATIAFGAVSKAVIAASPWLLLAAAAITAAYLIYTNWDAIVKFFTDTFGPVMDWLGQNWKTLLIIFTGGLGFLVLQVIEHWDEIVGTIQAAWNVISSVSTEIADTVVKTVLGMVNSIIDAVRKALDWLAKLPSNIVGGITDFFTGGPSGSTSGTSAKASTLGMPVISAATGFEGKLHRDTVFQAHAGENVSIVPASSIGGGRGGDTFYVTVTGSLWTTRELFDELDEMRVRQKRDRS